MKQKAGRKTNEEKGLPKKVGSLVYLFPNEKTTIIDKHGSLTAAILTTIKRKL
jgi:hypothetical protein